MPKKERPAHMISRTETPGSRAYDAGLRVAAEMAGVSEEEAARLAGSDLACELADAWAAIVLAMQADTIPEPLRVQLRRVQAATIHSARRKVRA